MTTTPKKSGVPQGTPRLTMKQLDERLAKIEADKAEAREKLASYQVDLDELRRKSIGTTTANRRVAQLAAQVQLYQEQLDQMDGAATNSTSARLQEAELAEINNLIDQNLGNLPEELGTLKAQVNNLAGEQKMLRTDVNEQGEHLNHVVVAHNRLDQQVQYLRDFNEKFPWVKFAIAALIGLIAGLIYWSNDQRVSIQLQDGSWKSFSSPELNSWPVTVGVGVLVFLAVLGLLMLIPARNNSLKGNTSSTAVPEYEEASALDATKPLPTTTPSDTDAEVSNEPLVVQGASRTH